MAKRLLVAFFVAAALIVGVAAAQTSPNTLAKIKSAKAINVAYSPDSLPFSFAGPNNEAAGYSIDLCKRVIAQIGRAVGEPDLKVNWLAGSVTERLQMVASGRADLECANTTQTQSRLANVDFSNLIFIDGGGVPRQGRSADQRDSRPRRKARRRVERHDDGNAAQRHVAPPPRQRDRRGDHGCQ